MKSLSLKLCLCYCAFIMLAAVVLSCALPKDFGSPKNEKIIQLKEVAAKIVNITQRTRAEGKDYLLVVYYCDDKVFRSLDKGLEFEGKIGDFTILTDEK